ncbi:MAG: MEKHLA domain-containing protein [Verrucomicrobia bacterium]|nr:MEKHLA domain-containing protein [Verrucomicrobiota bacterium]MCH8512604.1 MEKHLA domain-containing protein [Kiritimatiellia bacterium]
MKTVDLPAIICQSYHHWTGRHLVASPELTGRDLERALYALDQVVVAHDTRDDPVFMYANRAALDLFEMTLEDFTRLPSRFSAEPMARAEREALLREVRENGFTDAYSGVRVSSTGKRFFIEKATVWNLLDAGGAPCGQAATFPVPQRTCGED